MIGFTWNLFGVKLMMVSNIPWNIYVADSIVWVKLLKQNSQMICNRLSVNCSVVAERCSALDSSSGVVRMWVRIPAWPVAARVCLSKTIHHNCFVLRMGRKAVGPACCVMRVKEHGTLLGKEKGLAPVFLDSRLEHPAGRICVRYQSSVLLLLLLLFTSSVYPLRL